MNRFTSLLAICIVLSLSAYAQQWKVQKQGIPEIQYATEDLFGSAMATDANGNFVVVGAPHEDTGELNSGAAYIYQRVNGAYELVKKLTPSDPSEDKKFGNSVAIDDNIVVIGAPGEKADVWYGGATYIFVKGKDGWKDPYEFEKLTSPDPVTSGMFGDAVAVKENTVAVGQPGKYQKDHSGVVYVYQKSQSQQKMILKGTLKVSQSPCSTQCYVEYGKPQDPCINGCSTEFGHSIGFGDNYIAISAPDHDLNDFNDGAIFIFNKPKDGWKDATESTVLYLSDTTNNAELGRGISIRGDLLLAGGRASNAKEEGFGYAYLFQKGSSGWNNHPIATLKTDAPGGNASEYSVSLGDGYALLGIPMSYYNHSQDPSGGVYVYTKPSAGWQDASEDFRIRFTKVRESYFGQSVLSLGDTILIGAPQDNRSAIAAGSAFQVIRSEGEWKKDDMTRWETPREENASHYTFGEDAAIYENTMVIGAPQDNNYGAAYVYEKVNGYWHKVAKLTAEKGNAQDLFGTAVNIYQDCIIVGAPLYDDERNDGERRNNVGAAYLFEKPATGWQDMNETARFIASNTSDRFGYAVDLTDSFAVVGTKFRDTQSSGEVYIFEKMKQGWVSKTEDLRLHESSDIENNFIGETLDCNGNGVLVSQPLKNKAYLFEKRNGQWSIDNPIIFQLPTIEVAHALAKAFHLSVSLSKDIAVIGWPYDIREKTWGAGTVFIYRKVNGEWQTEPYVLKAPTLKASGFFGSEVDVDNDLLIVGANGGFSNDPDQRQPGEAFVYTRNGADWHLIETLSATRPTNGDMFGHSVGVSGTDFVIGAPHDANKVGYRAGSAYIFNRYGPWVEKVSSLQEDGWYGIGQDITINVHYDSAVYIESNPTISLYLDKGKASAYYQDGSGSTTLAFKYTVQEGHHAADLGYNGIFALKGELLGKDSVEASKLLPSPGRIRSLKGNKTLKIDGKRPIVQKSTFLVDSSDNQHAAVYWSSDESIHQLDSTMIEVINGRLTSVERIDSTGFITHIQPYHGQTTVILKEGVVKDKASNAALETKDSFWYSDTIAPQIDLIASKLFFSDANTILSIKMTEPVTGFSKEDINVHNGVVHQLTTSDSITFIAEVVALDEGKVDCFISTNSLSDVAGNPNVDNVSISLFYDVTSPTVKINSQASDTLGGVFIVTITFSDVIQKFEASDITVENSKIESLHTSDSTVFVAEVVGLKEGQMNISIPADVAYDISGNGNHASDLLSRFYDAYAPIIAPYQRFNVDENEERGVIIGTLTAEETIGTLQNWSITSGNESDVFTLNNHTGELSLTQPVDFEGQAVYMLTVTVNDGIYTAEPTLVEVYILDKDEANPSVQFVSEMTDSVSSSFLVDIIFSEVVQDFTVSDIIVQNATLNELQTADSTSFTTEIKPLDRGLVSLNIPAEMAFDIASNGNQAAETFTIYYKRAEIEPVVLGIDEKVKSLIHIGPNPTSGILTIDIPHAYSVDQILLLDQYGKVVFSSPQTNTLELPIIPQGVYTLFIQGKAFTVSKKVIYIR
uniref:Ig-like domain-containing protein n=1 Tax=Roseihalotalea indica TaxID=2867963 RepID=A0AA49JKA6_9BACT|nr:Ig-like domain-containing protein [Tunicatimonas sp. TK19036]